MGNNFSFMCCKTLSIQRSVARECMCVAVNITMGDNTAVSALATEDFQLERRRVTRTYIDISVHRQTHI
jgi:hypothetical protein